MHLLEMSAGLMLASLLLSAGVLCYASLARAQALKFEARRLKAVLEQLSIDALQREMAIVVELEERGYMARKRNASGGVLLKYCIKEPVRITSVSRGTRLITFYPSGVITPATIVLGDKENLCRVTISLRGRVSMRCGSER